MDDNYAPDLDRAARRREQNRIAQRNHRRRKRLARQNSLEQEHRQVSTSSQPTPNVVEVALDDVVDYDDEEIALSSFPFETPPWEEESTTTGSSSLKQGYGVDDSHMGVLQNDLLDVFDSPVYDLPSAGWNPEPAYHCSLDMDNEPPRGASGTASKNTNLQSVLADHERRTSNGSGRDSSSMSRRERLPPPYLTPTASSSFTQHSPAPPKSTTRSRSRTQSMVATAELERPSPGGRARSTSSFHQRQQQQQQQQEQQRQQHERQQRPPGRRQAPPPQDRADNTFPARRTTASVENHHGRTCLHLAAAEGSTTLVRYFLRRGMGPDARDGDGLTALHHAIRGGHEDTVNALLFGGADMEVTDSRGRTPLHFAVEQRQDDIAILLIHKGADMHATVPPHPSRRRSP